MRPALDLNCFRQCWHLRASCSCGHGPTCEQLASRDLHSCPRGQPYLLTYFHVLLEPHQGLPRDHAAGGAHSLPPFVDGPLPLFLGATCGAGPGPQGLAGAPGHPGCQAQNPGSMLSRPSTWSRACPTIKTWPGPHYTGDPTWGQVGRGGRHLLADCAGRGRHLLPDVLRARPILLLGAAAAGLVFCLDQACAHERGGQLWSRGTSMPLTSPVPPAPRRPGPHL